MADLSQLSEKDPPMILNEQPNRVRRTVRLFPRLATAKKAPVLVRVDQPHGRGRRIPLPAPNSRETELARLRARLLAMILENESVRRNDLWPRVS